VKRLFTHLDRLRRKQVSIIYVSHRLDEIFTMTDRVAVLRDGGLVATYKTAEVDVNRLIRDMVGRSLEQVYLDRGSDRRDRRHSRRVENVPLLSWNRFPNRHSAVPRHHRAVAQANRL